MWYLIKDIRNNTYSIRYYKYTEQKAPTIIFYTARNLGSWSRDISLLISLESPINPNGFYSIAEMEIIGFYIITPLPTIPFDIKSTSSILEAHPELFI